MAAGRDVLMDHDGAKKISALLRDYFAPEAVGSVYQEVVQFLQFKRATQRTDGNLARFDLLRVET